MMISDYAQSLISAIPFFAGAGIGTGLILWAIAWAAGKVWSLLDMGQ